MAKVTKKTTQLNFWQKPAGYFVSTAVLLVAAYVLFSLAVDSGSILQWLGALVALLWGVARFIQGSMKALLHKTHDKRR